MDPNEALRVIREECAHYAADDGEFDAWRLAEHAAALDGWLTAGGFLPDAWFTPGAVRGRV